MHTSEDQIKPCAKLWVEQVATVSEETSRKLWEKRVYWSEEGRCYMREVPRKPSPLYLTSMKARKNADLKSKVRVLTFPWRHWFTTKYLTSELDQNHMVADFLIRPQGLWLV